MKKTATTLLTQIILLFLTAGLLFGQGTTITLLHVNDSHSHLDAVGPKDSSLEGTLGGIARAATVIGTVRATEDHVLLLHAGDVFQGDPFYNKYFGVPEFELMKQLGFDAMAVGNHEFDFGPGFLSDILSTAFAGGSFPLLSANLDMSAFPALKAWIQPSMMKSVGGVKIGIFGMTVPHNPTNMPDPVIVRDDLVPVAQEAVTTLKNAGADVIICLSHLGIFYDKIVASNVTGIDFIIGGHDHFLFEQPLSITAPSGQPTLIFQAGEHYKFVGKLRFTVDNGKVTVNDYTVLHVDGSVPPEPSIQPVIEALKAGIVDQFGDLYGTALGTATTELTKRFDLSTPYRDTPIGNLVTDAFRNKTGTEIAITALGLISEKIYAGPIVGADVFRAMSYGFDEETGLGFKLATLTIRGRDLLKGLEVGLSQLEVGDDLFLQVSGMEFNYSPRRPVGHRVTVGSIRIHGKPFLPPAKYTVTVNTGIVALLTNLNITPENVRILPDFEFTVVRDYISHLGIVQGGVEGRIQDESVILHPTVKGDPKNAPLGLPMAVQLHQNYPNPFNPTTTIDYTLPEARFVSLKIYDVLGREVETLVNGVQDAGHTSVTFTARDLPSGLYFYRLKAGNFVDVKKMMLTK
jgi:5'-nucleotidase / UDP-sugar diphosphatase